MTYERAEKPNPKTMLDAKARLGERAVMANAASTAGFTPRFIARTLGLSIGDITAMCKRQCALGVLERFEHKDTKEFYYRKGPNFPSSINCVG